MCHRRIRPAFGTSPSAPTTIGAADLFGHEFVVPPHCATRRWRTHGNQSYGCLHRIGLEDGGRVNFAHGDKEAVAHGSRRPALREKRSSGSRLFGVALLNARVDPNLRTICRGCHPWNQPRLCVHRRLKRQYILHLFASCDVVPSRIRAYGVPCYSICKDQTS